jgi:hypothetical protein
MKSEWPLGNWTASCNETANLAFIMLNFNVWWQFWITTPKQRRPPSNEDFPKNSRPASSITLTNPRISTNSLNYAWNSITESEPMPTSLAAWIIPTRPPPKQLHPLPTRQATPPVLTAVITAPHQWTSLLPKNRRTNATMTNEWPKASAFTVDRRTILRTNAPLWPATMPGRFILQLQVYLPPTWTPFPPLPWTRDKISPLAAHWLCWWTYPGVFIRFCSGSFICIC